MDIKMSKRNVAHLVGKKVKVIMVGRRNNQMITFGTLHKPENSKGHFFVCPHSYILSLLFALIFPNFIDITCSFPWDAVSLVEGNTIYLFEQAAEL